MVTEISEKDREEMLEQVEELAEAYMRQSGVCGQAVLLALQKVLGLSGGPMALKAASFTGAGIVGMGHMCGALLGGIMAIGLAAGRQSLEDSPYPESEVLSETMQPKSYVIIRRFYQKFLQEFGNWICRDLQIKKFGRGFEWGVPGEWEKWVEAGGMEYCGPLVGKTARLAAEAIFILPRR